ncbi:sugar porter family MFS transporter [Desulfosarcina sp.]|nr:sugar porter family MFS transporter [Desulfosarcina sp.]
MKKSLYLYSLVAALGGLLFGFDTAVINGALPFLRDYFKLTETMEGWAISSAILGCVIGALFIGRPGDIFGRRFMLKIVAILYLISAVGSGLADNISTFIIYRIIGGIAVGGASVLSPTYISEISPAKYRGRFTITFQMAIVIGILLAFFSDYLLIGIGENNWRWMFIAEAIPASFFFVMLFFVARSPRWLVKSGKIDEARETIEKVNIGVDANKLIEEIKQSIDEKVVNSLAVLFRKPYLKLIYLGIFIAVTNQLTGINIIMYYSTDIFREAGFSTESGIAQTVIIGATNLLFTILAMMVIDKIGRKKMLLSGALGMSVFLALFAHAFITNIGGYVLLGYLVGFVACFAFSHGAVVWVLFSEMFPNNVRARGVSISSFSNWTANALTIFLFPIIARNYTNGIGYLFAFYAIVTFLSFFIFKKYIVETKGKTLEALEKEMLK